MFVWHASVMHLDFQIHFSYFMRIVWMDMRYLVKFVYLIFERGSDFFFFFLNLIYIFQTFPKAKIVVNNLLQKKLQELRAKFLLLLWNKIYLNSGMIETHTHNINNWEYLNPTLKMESSVFTKFNFRVSFFANFILWLIFFYI